MPNYTFRNTETGEEFEEFMKMDDKEQFLKDNPNFMFVFKPVALPGDHIMGVGPKETTQFKERMQKVSEAHPMSCLLYTSPSPRDRTRSRMPSSA